MTTWINSQKDFLQNIINDCFKSFDICEKCLDKEACDAVWEIVRKGD